MKADALLAATCLCVALGVTHVAMDQTWWTGLRGLGWLFIAFGCWRQRDEILRKQHK